MPSLGSSRHKMLTLGHRVPVHHHHSPKALGNTSTSTQKPVLTKASESASLVLELEGVEVRRLHVAGQCVSGRLLLLGLGWVGRPQHRREQLVIARVVLQTLDGRVQVSPVVQARLEVNSQQRSPHGETRAVCTSMHHNFH